MGRPALGARAHIPARFIDLSAGAQMAVAKAEFERRMAEAAEAAEPTSEARGRTDLETELVRHDPLTELAHAAGRRTANGSGTDWSSRDAIPATCSRRSRRR